MGLAETIILPNLGSTEKAFWGKCHQSSAPENEEQAPTKAEGTEWKEAVMEPARSLQAAVES